MISPVRVFISANSGRLGKSARVSFLAGVTPAARLQRWCHANGKICSRTGLQHQELAGRAPGGKHWTAIAAAYPPALSKAIATSMIEAAESLMVSTLWN
eukprot:8334541-Pyramimonas_sp.AAC.1